MTDDYKPYYRQSFALVIGIDEYHHHSPLDHAENDAELIVETLVQDLGFPKENIARLINQEATKEQILHEFASLTDMASDANDRVLVFYAGHGYTAQGIRGDIGFLVPVDGNVDDKATLIRWDELTRNAELIAAKHILFIMDACYSGLILQRALPPGRERFLTEMLRRRSWQAITAGKADETVADGGGPSGENSIFTGYLIEGLRGDALADDGILTANGLMHFVYNKVGSDDRSQQTPHYGHILGDGDFILLSPDDEHLSQELAEDYKITSLPEAPPEPLVEEEVQEVTFIEENGYRNPQDPNFGRNDLSDNLVEVRRYRNEMPEYSKAYSWLALVSAPVSPSLVKLDPPQVQRDLVESPPDLDLPAPRFHVPQRLKTTLDAGIRYQPERALQDEYAWERYLRLDEQGNMEYAGSIPVFLQFEDVRMFRYVSIVGLAWQFVHLSSHVLTQSGYSAGVKLIFNLVGTRATILGDFAREYGPTREKWIMSH